MIDIYHNKKTEYGMVFYLYKDKEWINIFEEFEDKRQKEVYLFKEKRELIEVNFEFYVVCANKVITDDSTQLEKDCLDKLQRYLGYICKEGTKYEDVITQGNRISKYMVSILDNVSASKKRKNMLYMMTHQFRNLFKSEAALIEQYKSLK